MVQLRSMVSDWPDGTAPAEDYKKYKRAQGRVLMEGKSAAPHRVVGPSSTQLQLVRAMVRAIYDENSELRQSRQVPFGLLGSLPISIYQAILWDMRRSFFHVLCSCRVGAMGI